MAGKEQKESVMTLNELIAMLKEAAKETEGKTIECKAFLDKDGNVAEKIGPVSVEFTVKV